MRSELSEYTDILLGRSDPPINKGEATLMEVAEAYHARAREMEMKLLEAETEGYILKDSKAYRFRTGELRAFTELTRKAIDMGNRRITMALEQLRAYE